MNKGLEMLEKAKKRTGLPLNKEFAPVTIDELDIIEKELKQAEENEKLLNVFKNALTIEHHDYPTIEHDDSEDVVSYLVKELYTIRQSELDKDMRKALKEWVLKNAFPKEIKALEIIKKYAPDIELYHDLCCLVDSDEEIKLIKEVLL